MDKEFGKDLYDGLSKIVEIGSWLLDCLKLESVRNFKSWKKEEEEREKGIIIAQPFPEESQKNKKSKKVNSIKPKGDIELKNIQYRIVDKRYIGRKQIKKQIITVYGKTQKETYQKLQAEINKVMSNLSIPRATQSKLFINVWNVWYEENKKPFITKETQNEIERIKMKLHPLHSLPVSKINKERIQEFLKTFEEGRAKEKIVLYLKAFMKYAFEDGLVKANPFAKIKVKPKLQIRKPAFTYEQQAAILDRLKNEKIKPIILVYLITGLRRREFDFKNIGNCLDDENYLLKAVNLKGRNLIVRYKTIQLSKEGYLLIKNNIELFKEYTEERVYRKFNEILKEIGINGSIVNLRHTFATNNFYLGNPELFISRQMGHSTSQITKDNYTDIDYHLSKEKIYKLYNNLYYIF